MPTVEKILETDNKTKFTYWKENISKKTGSGKFKAQIFEGRFDETRLLKTRGKETTKTIHQTRVAIKSYQIEVGKEIEYERARENLEYLSQTGNKHPNLIRYFDHKVDGQFIYLVIELCLCSVAELINPKLQNKEYKKYVLGFPNISNPSTHEREEYYPTLEQKVKPQEILTDLPKKEILRQSAEAVNFLHNLGLIHRNLHPDNFLVTFDVETQKYLVKLTDFQYAKDWVDKPEYSGSYDWSDWNKVPENPSSIDSKADVFLLGCYFYYVLTNGNHPFASIDKPFKSIKENISERENPVYQENWNGGAAWGNVDNVNKDKLPLIRCMIRHHPAGRKSAWEVLQYLQQNEESYNLYDGDNNTKLPGLCVIIAQKTFHDPVNDIMPDNDCAQLWRTFTRFGLEVIIFKNLRGDQIIHYLDPAQLQAKAKNDLVKYGSLVVCILSHGSKGLVYGVDLKAVPIEGLKYKLGRCKDLNGKPKMFVILACQGDNDQLVLKDNDVTFDSTQPDFPMNMPKASSMEEDSMTDFLTLISSIENFYTYFTPGVGSLFIESLCGALMSEYNDESIKTSEAEKVKKDVVSLFHSSVLPRVAQEVFWVNDKMTNRMQTAKQTPEVRSTLKRAIRFRAVVKTVDIAKKPELKATLEPVFDGQKDDPCFEHARTYYEKLFEELENQKKTP